MYDIEIKKGQCFRYDIWFGGEPPPIVTWERKDGIINSETDPARITLELRAKKKVYCERNTVLTVKKVIYIYRIINKQLSVDIKRKNCKIKTSFVSPEYDKYRVADHIKTNMITFRNLIKIFMCKYVVK